jgi:Cu-Zn family superoxide dismutase
MNRLWLSLFLATLVSTAACTRERAVEAGGGVLADTWTAHAVLYDANGREVGRASFIELDNGVRVTLDAWDLEPGEKGFHIHESGRCEPPDFKSAGNHFNPSDRRHGFENPDGPHLGDLHNLHVEDDGSTQKEEILEGVTLAPSEHSLLRRGGSAIVIHADPDDYRTDPAGNAGDRIACGVIERGGL